MDISYSNETQPYMGVCVNCKDVRTAHKDEEGEFRCAACCNKKYFNDLSSGKKVELKIDMRKVKQSTLILIKSLILKDEEEYSKNNPVTNHI